MGKHEQQHELSHWRKHQKSYPYAHRPIFVSGLISKDIGSPGLYEENCDTSVLNRFKITTQYFLLIPILTLSRSRIRPWKGKPVFIRNITVENSNTSLITSVLTSIDKKIPIREFLSMQKNILSMISCKSPISLMELLERRLDPLRPGPWIDMHSREIDLSFNSYSHQSSLGIRTVRKIFLISHFSRLLSGK